MPPRRPYCVRDVEVLRQRMAASERVVQIVPHSVRSLAEQVESNRGTIGALLTGKQSSLSEELAQAIARELKCPVEDLFVPTEIAFPTATEASASGSAEHPTGAHDE